MADLGGGVWAVRPDREGTPEQLLDEVGRVPLPPYIRGGVMEEADVGALPNRLRSPSGGGRRADRRPAFHQ